MDVAIVTAIISAVTTLIVSMGTWHVSAKQARKKDTEALKTELVGTIEKYRDELRGKMETLVTEMGSVRDEIKAVDNSMKMEIQSLNLQMKALSDQVERHNHVVERTYKLEEKTEVQAEQIKVANHRIDDLERGKA